ncbi:MAG: hypothetical protein A2846_01225 [Candidatus Doudnabacteria bacterium RIFCSPHIGHO2_01_FULL_49_9]|uniref:Uncharacterized protein n=1 Tax=Candidatus Doudnabacteria bacterium RIFCSPHIGHO2_01_FULL_49_9 TaxID=1817827 RepID=A0A1F5P3D0_9BACT|nr:MAG: hypothetical protein A2846_01225 [Candidatus Doudnabacteria bacterium RIFCSPHIGHO2_01_FULL_49_9]
MSMTTEKGWPFRPGLSITSEAQPVPFSSLKANDKCIPAVDSEKPLYERRRMMKLDGEYKKEGGQTHGNAVIYGGPSENQGITHIPEGTHVIKS